ncbi:MAG TPA: TadG family pilus assembly protein [Stenotrophobium sp.]|nr:TadG family pilus assembly protein [Stenotrophobium sp.]
MRSLKPRTDRRSSRRRQHGAVAIFVAISLIAILAAVALSIDIGRLYFAQRDLQRLAVLGALSAAQQVSGCANNGVPGAQADAEAEVTRIIALNNPSGTTIGKAGFNGSPYVEVGKIETATGGSGLRGFKPLADGDPQIDSVRVNLTTPAPARLLPFLGSAASGTLYASATATQSALGSLRIGSGIASLNQGLLNSLLSGLLGGNVNLTVADYTGLANVNVTASQLATALGISVTDLSDPTTLNQTVLAGAALSGLTGALSGGVVNPQVISTLQTLAGQSSNTTPIPLGSILTPVGNIAGDVPFVNLQDLVMALALASRSSASGGPTPIQLNNTIADIPGVATIKVFATVIQPPKLGMGRAGQTSASTAQVLLSVRIQAGALLNGLSTGISGVLNGLLNALGGVLGLKTTISVASPPLNLGIDAVVAPATAYLDKLQCPAAGVNNGQPIASLSAQTGIAAVNVGTFSDSAISAPLPAASSASLPLADINLDATCIGAKLGGLCLGLNLGSTDLKLGLALTSLGVGSSGRKDLLDVTQFTPVAGVSPPSYLANNPGTTDTNPQTLSAAASAQLSLGLTNTQTGGGLIGILGGLVNSLVSGVTGLVQPLLSLVNGLLSSLINPLLQTLGIGLGNATVTMGSVTVARPAIVSECLPGVALPRGCPTDLP